MDLSNVKRRLTCILAADAVGYSSQMGTDEEGTVRVLSAHRAVIDGIIAYHNGRILSTAGDSVLAEFASVVEAVRCAVETQDALKTRNDALPEHRRMLFRIGVNLGDVMVKNDDLLGDGVNVAARLEGIAEPGGICISSSVYDQITGKLDLGFQDIGEQSLKNISRPIRVFRVSGAGAPARPTPPARKSLPIALFAAGAVAIAAIVSVAAWQAGWVRLGSTQGGGPTRAAPVATAAPAPPAEKTGEAADAAAARAQIETERLRADAEALKRQAEATLAQARAEAEATAAAARLRAEAEADAARIRAEAAAAAARAEATAAAARAKSDADAAARREAAEKARAAQTVAKVDAVAAALAKSGTTPPVAASAVPAPAATASNAGSFDGTWNVTVVCPTHASGAQGYTLEFVAQVKAGVLRGEHGREGNSGWLLLQGPIQPDGAAKLDARGITGDPRYNMAGAGKGVPFAYTVAARFDGSRGNGRRQELRPCDLRFVKK